MEAILKTVMSPTEPLEAYVENYLLLVSDKSTVNFTKLLELKGIRKPEQNPLIDMFNKRIPHHDNLAENSNMLPLEVLQQTANGSTLTGVGASTAAGGGGGGAIPSSITTSLSTIASTAASNFNHTSSPFRTSSSNTANSPNSATSPTSLASPTTEGTRGRLNENFRKLVMTGMAFRKDLQERRDHQSS